MEKKLIYESKGEKIRKQVIGGPGSGPIKSVESITEADLPVELVPRLETVETEKEVREKLVDAYNFLRQEKGLKESFGSFLKNLKDNIAEDLADDFDNQTLADFIKEFKEKRAIEKKEQEKVLLAEKKRLLSEEKRLKEKIPYITLAEFRLMEQASKWRQLVNRTPELTKNLPRTPDGTPFTIPQIKELAEKYKNLMRNPTERSRYDQAALNLMKKAAAWNFLYEKISKQVKQPTWPDGKLMNRSEIDNLVKDYEDFRKEKPEEFAELKVENNEWLADEFKWNSHWMAEKPIVLKDKNGKITELRRLYIARPLSGFKPEEIKKSYYTIKSRSSEKNGDTIFVDLKFATKK